MSDHNSRALDRVQPRFRSLTASRFWLGTTCLLLLVLQGCGESNESGGLAGPDPSSSDDVGFLTQPPVSQDAAPEPVGCVDRDGDGFGDNCEAGPDCNDRQASAHQGATEQCGDGFDNDCDDRVDEGCGCTEGEAVPCYPAADQATAGIGRCRTGFRVCHDGALGACEDSRTPIEEICNGEDDDCDGTTDEGVLNACGQCGDLGSETCDGQDNDCDGQTDEGVLNACGGCGLEPDEYCDGLDNDCDGQTDEDCRCLSSISEPCYTEHRALSMSQPVELGIGVFPWVIAAHPADRPHDEQCNGLDDDCDGDVDEGLTNRWGECGPQPRER